MADGRTPAPRPRPQTAADATCCPDPKQISRDCQGGADCAGASKREANSARQKTCFALAPLGHHAMEQGAKKTPRRPSGPSLVHSKKAARGGRQAPATQSGDGLNGQAGSEPAARRAGSGGAGAAAVNEHDEAQIRPGLHRVGEKGHVGRRDGLADRLHGYHVRVREAAASQRAIAQALALVDDVGRAACQKPGQALAGKNAAMQSPHEKNGPPPAARRRPALCGRSRKRGGAPSAGCPPCRRAPPTGQTARRSESRWQWPLRAGWRLPCALFWQ